MKWENLLSLKRHGDNLKRLRSEQDNTRVGFDVDYDRIVFSSFFRSLQDKTQVIPFSKTSFVHTRLTHSLEVSVVGRSLGRIVGKHILNKHPYLNQIHGYQINDFGSIVAAASLAHDIGNPPFGHSGESAIGDFYKIGDGFKYKSQLTDLQYNDLCTFEGNANGFKILTESKPGSQGGLRLSYATLGAFTKYPKSSLPHKPTKHIKDKKYGYFSSQSDFFDEVATELGLKNSDNQYSRHPLTYLVEAADDICYTLIDFEDGINLDWIPEEFALEFLVKLVSESIDRKKYNSMGLKSQRIAYLRALAINTLINEAVNIFIENEDKILKGELETSLMSLSKYKSQMESIIEISIDKVYKSKEVIEKELTGYKVLNFLLKTFTSSVINWREDKVSAFDELALECIPKEYLNKDTDLYSNLLDVSCFIASLTDGLALEWYKKLS